MRSFRISQGVVFSLSLIIHAVSASASPSPYVVSGLANFNFGPILSLNDFGHLSLEDPIRGDVILDVQGSPLVKAETSIGVGSGRASGILHYQVEIVGPNGFVPVFVSASGAASGSASEGGAFAVVARWSLFFDQSNPLASDEIVSGQIDGGSFSESFNSTTGVMMIANLPYTVELVADSSSATNGDPGAHASSQAFVDPVFTLDPGVDPLLYTITVSEGVSNTPPAVPEPASAITVCVLGAALASTRWGARRLAVG